MLQTDSSQSSVPDAGHAGEICQQKKKVKRAKTTRGSGSPPQPLTVGSLDEGLLCKTTLTQELFFTQQQNVFLFYLCTEKMRV
jgi:hypothetical protein